MKPVHEEDGKTFYGDPTEEEKTTINAALDAFIGALKSTSVMQDGKDKHGFGLLRKEGVIVLFLDVKGLSEKDYDTMAKVVAAFGLTALEAAAQREGEVAARGEDALMKVGEKETVH